MSDLYQEIQVLPPDVVNQIAAGEVVERPAHLIKELIENSVDAGCTDVLIEIHGDARNIKVKDNGSGIRKEELLLALQRHATSKIQLSEDLFRLASYGFRGEALASIASVSELTLLSRKRGEKKSYQVYSHFGELSEVFDSSISEGTEVFVRSLFENTPARLKFLKSAATELGQIKSVIRAMALSHPYVQFKLLVNGELDLIYPAVQKDDQRSLGSRYKNILGVKNIFLAAQEQSLSTNHNIKCEVAFASPNEVAKTAKNIWIFVQNRWVQDRTVTAAIMDSFRTLLMHGEYPQVALFVSTPPEFVDVNISPTKSQVKFINSSDVFRAVQSTLRNALSNAPWFSGQNRSLPREQFHAQHSFATNEKVYTPKPTNLSFLSDARTSVKTKDFTLLKVDEMKNIEIPASVAGLGTEAQPKHWSSFHVIGQFDLTYIVCQKDDRLILVDQHAAHERVAFEKLMKKWQGGDLDIQSFLFPLQINLNESKVEVLLSHQNQLQKMGLEIERLGPESIGVKSAPLIVRENALNSAIEKMAQDLVEYGDSFQFEKSIADLFATMACHSVIRAGQALSAAEMQELLVEMDQFPYSSFCPHGRPVSIEWDASAIEKLFGRRN